jgi:hypothetical protein
MKINRKLIRTLKFITGLVLAIMGLIVIYASIFTEINVGKFESLSAGFIAGIGISIVVSAIKDEDFF